MKTEIKILSFMLFIVTLLSLLSGCIKGSEGNGEGSESNEPEATESETVAETEEIKELCAKLTDDSGKLLYTTIRFPAEPSESLMNAVKKLRDKIKELTGGTPMLYASYPSKKITPANDAYEIIVGDLPFEECREMAESVLYGDYHITIVGKKIIVAAYAEGELIRALNYISGMMLKETDESGNPLCEITAYSYLTPKPLKSVTVNGVDLRKFSIVYGTKGSDDSYNLEAAKNLCGQISKAVGYLLPVIKDTEKCETEHKLYVGTQFSGLENEAAVPQPKLLHYECKTVGKDYFIVAGGGYTLRAAVAEFVAKYLGKATEDGTVNITDQNGNYYKVSDAPRAEGSEMRVMTYNILAAHWTEYMDVQLRYEPFKAVLDTYDPDIVGLQEVCTKWIQLLNNGISDKYGIIHPRTPDNLHPNFSVIIYKKDRFEVVKQGLEYLTPQGPNYIRLVNWVILKDKQTGKLVAFFNTHWDPSSGPHGADHAKILNKVMEENPDVKYVFSTGDYNAKPGTEAYTTFITQTGLLNASDVAKAAGTLKNDAGGCAVVGTNKESLTTNGPIDHIIISNNVKVLSFETILWNRVEQVSDHAPKYADVTLN